MRSSESQFRVPPFPAFPSVSRYVAIGSIEEAFSRVCRSIEARDGISLVFGPPGTGKSLLTKAIIEAYTDTRDVIVVGENPIETPQAFYQHVLHHLGVACTSAQSDLQLTLIDRVNGNKASAGGLVIVVDEAQSLSGDVLEAIRRTTNIMRRDEPRVCAVLCGGPALEDTLARPSMQPFVQRVATRCYLHPLNAAETSKYITESIRNCGAEPDDTITDEAIAAVHHACNGVPRLINQMMTQAIDTAEAAGQILITDVIVDRAWALLQQLPSPMIDEPSFASTDTTIEFGQLDDLDEAAPVADSKNTPASIAETESLSAIYAADQPVSQTADCESCDADCSEPCAAERNELVVSSGSPAAAFDDLGPVVEFEFAAVEPVPSDEHFKLEDEDLCGNQVCDNATCESLSCDEQIRLDMEQPAENDRPLIASEDDCEFTAETTVRLDELQSMSEIVVGGFDAESAESAAAGSAQIACEPALIDSSIDSDNPGYQYPAANGKYDIDQVETQHLAQSQQAISSQSTAETNGSNSIAAEIYAGQQEEPRTERDQPVSRTEPGANAFDLPAHTPSVAGVPHGQPINQSLYTASTIEEGQYRSSEQTDISAVPQSAEAETRPQSSAAKELFGSFEDEVVVPVAAGPGAADGEPLDLNSIYGQSDLESILHQEIVGMSADASRLHVFHEETDGDVNANSNQQRRADGPVRSTRQPVLWLTETDQGALVSDDSDLLIIEDSVEVSPVAPAVTFDDDEQPVSVDFQAMLERMRSSG